MNFQEALAYLDEHMSYHKTGRIDSPSVEPITAICSALGDPHLSAPVIHVTGTNGKGSTVQIISRLLAAQGLTVGTYTSPHLEHVTERFKRNGEPITEEELAEQIGAVAEIAPLVGQNPGYFEILTAAAFRWFADIAVDVMVIEVGLLGRWDATNIVESQVAVITNIGMDHNEFAGPSIARRRSGEVGHRQAGVSGDRRRDRSGSRRHLPHRRWSDDVRPRRRLRDAEQRAGGQRTTARPADADDDLHRCLPAAERCPPGRQRRPRARPRSRRSSPRRSPRTS